MGVANRDLTAAQRVALARHAGRPGTADFIAALITTGAFGQMSPFFIAFIVVFFAIHLIPAS